MKYHNEDSFIDSILKNTKNIVKKSDNYFDYYNNKNNSFFSKQLPIIYHSRNYSQSQNKSESSRSNNDLINNPIPLNNIRYESLSKNKLPKLYSIFNTENIIPSLITSSKIEKKLIKKHFRAKSLGLNPLILSQSNSNDIIGTYEEYEKDFFWDVNYSDLKYDENEIFGHKKKYDTIVKDKIKQLKKEKNENQTYFLEKEFNYGKSEKMNLSLTSMTIEFEDYATNETNENLKINFPFALLPLFYFKGIESFQILLTTILKFENDYKKISFDEEALYIYLNNLKDFETEEKEDKNLEEEKKSTLNNINKKKMKKNLFRDKNFSTISESARKERPNSLRPNILKRNKFFLRFNYFIFFWTTNTQTFKVTITLPLIKLNILENNILVQLFANYELLFFLYSKNFLNWDFYIIKYLSSFKKFRYILKRLGSHHKILYENIFLKEPKYKVNTFSEEILLNIHTDENNRNQIIKFQSFNLKINLKDTTYSYETEYHIHFTFFHFIKLVQIAKYESKILFLLKFLNIRDYNNTLDFNYDNYDEFDIKSWLENVEKFNPKFYESNSFVERDYREFELFTKIVGIEFIKPIMTLIRFENKTEVSKSCQIENELEDELVESILHGNSKNFNRLLNLCLKKMHAPTPSPYISHSVSFSPLMLGPNGFKNQKEYKEKIKQILFENQQNNNKLRYLSKEFKLKNIRNKRLSAFNYHNYSQPLIIKNDDISRVKSNNLEIIKGNE